jgi:hypothetical protein
MLIVPELRLIGASSWGSASDAFRGAPSLVFRQAWLPAAQEKLRPGVVRLGWQKATIVVMARLVDEVIFTRATEDHQRFWQLGDVFEIFLKGADLEEYLELHVAPSGRRSQFRFASRRVVEELRKGTGRIENFVVKAPLFDFRVRTVTGAWEILASIHSSSLGLRVSSLAGSAVLASFGRYDYSDDAELPVLSSTSPHEELNFHRQQEWTKLVFCHSTLDPLH